PLDPSKTVSSLTLPSDTNVELLSATLIPASSTPVKLSPSFNRTGLVTDGSTFPAFGGLDGGSFALSSNLLGSGTTWNGASFTFGPAGANDVVSAAGQSIALPAGSYSSLQLLATAVNG